MKLSVHENRWAACELTRRAEALAGPNKMLFLDQALQGQEHTRLIKILGCPNGPPPESKSIERSLNILFFFIRHSPPSQTAFLPWTIRMGSSDTSCIALSGRGCNDISVCSKRGSDAAAGREACIVDHRSALLGACGGGASTGGRFCAGVGEGTGVPVCGGEEVD